MSHRTVLKLYGSNRLLLNGAGMLAVVGAMTLGVMNAPALYAQEQSNERFEVASVRRVEVPDVSAGVPVFPTTGGIGTASPRRISYRATWLSPLIATAFGVRSDQVIGPEWLARARYDIIANIPEGATQEQFKRMLGNLVRDRFHLRFHIESRVRPVYVLRVATSGPKFKETARRAGDATAPSRASGTPDANGFPVLPPDYRGMVSVPRSGELFVAAQDVPIASLAATIEPRAGRPIVDETGLTGRYDFKIHFEWIRRGPDAGVVSDAGPSVFTALEEQLGLRLEPASRAFDHLIIDSIYREPTDN